MEKEKRGGVSVTEKEQAQALLEIHMSELRIKWTPEFKFHPTRKWKADYKVSPSVLVEIEGGVFSQGRHTRGVGYTKDCEKYNEAQSLGYKVYRFTTQQVLTGKAKEFLKKYL